MQVAFSFPFSYEEVQADTARIAAVAEARPDVHFHRSHLVDSLKGHRVDLLTLTACPDESDEPFSPMARPADPAGILFPQGGSAQPDFTSRPRVFVSARVHPGETPAQFALQGFLDFLLRPDDPRSAALLRKYVFLIVPVLNPDGLVLGHYR